jgi:hypothetical protein
MNKDVETIKTEIDMLSKGVKAYHDMVSDKLTSLVKRINDITKKEKSAKEITQEDWMWIPRDGECWWFISNDGMVLSDYSNIGNSGLKHKYITCNIFKTKELAESRKHLSPPQRKWAFILDYLGRDESKIDFKRYDNKYFPYAHSSLLFIGCSEFRQQLHKSQYTLSKDICIKATKIMGDDIYPYLWIDKP